MEAPEALAFVLSKKHWVTRQIERSAVHAAQFPPPASGEIWWRGELLDLVNEPGIRRVQRTAGVCRVDFNQAEAQLRAGLRADLALRIEAILLDALPLGPRPSGFQIRRMKSRWGSCSRDGRMRFNEALSHLDDRCLRYVVCHEMAHLVHFNHSAAFYTHLAQILPTHREDERHVHAHQHLLVHGGYALPASK
jgi:predicted metal-dependent hydrolase